MKLKPRERKAIQLTREERKGVYRGVRRIVRAEKPDLEGGDTLIVSWTRGGRYIVDRETGETAERARRPTVWLRFEEPHELDDGTWAIRYEIHDERETTRKLAAGAPGARRESGLKTRARDHKKIPKRGAEIESFTPETERGYVSGGSTLEPLEAVDDELLAAYALDARERWEQSHPEETKEQEMRRLSNKARRLQREAERRGVDLSADLTAFIERAREAIVAAKEPTK